MKDYPTNWVLNCSKNTFDLPIFRKWFKKLFYIGGLIHNQSQSKQFHWTGVAITTDGVKASLHYERINSSQVEADNVDIAAESDDKNSTNEHSDTSDVHGGDILLIPAGNDNEGMMEHGVVIPPNVDTEGLELNDIIEQMADLLDDSEGSAGTMY